MGTITMKASVADRRAREVFDLLRDFELYPKASPAILSIDVDESTAPSNSTWRVQFREGIIVWTERDEIDEELMELRFEQIDGDFERLVGRWQVSAVQTGCEVELTTEFDFGIPSLTEFIDPLAQHALYDNGVQLLQGLLGGAAKIVTPAPDSVDWEAGL
jgi:ribosome-associated toxin RatA of RatAB toxin-antitoxin module